MRVCAYDGDSRYIVSMNDDLDAAKREVAAPARVFDAHLKALLKPTTLGTLLRSGDWKAYILSPEETDALLAQHGVTAAA